MILTKHQLKQQEVVNKIESQINNQSLSFSTVTPVEDYEEDSRICLTSVHLPDNGILKQVEKVLIHPLREIEPNFYYYPKDSLHLTIKNIRIINNPPHFNKNNVQKAKEVFSTVIPNHKSFKIYFYKLLLFPNNLALVGTTDPELDNIVLDLHKSLEKMGVPDDKVYANSRYFFSNMTLARFNTQPPTVFKKKVLELSNTLKFEPYLVDSVTLLSGNAVLKKRKEIETWQLLKTDN